MKESCIIAPIHEPYFNTYGLDFVKSYNCFFNDNDLFLVFSNDEGYEKFKNIAHDLRFNKIICENLGDEPASPITRKKLYGLNHVFKNTNFKRAGVVDVDTIFLKYLDYDKYFKEFVDNKKIYTSIATNSSIYRYVTSPKKFYNDIDNDKLNNITKNFTSYFWFNDIPVYDKDYFLNFCDYINYDNIRETIAYDDFDFVMYVYYLLIKDLATMEYFVDNDNNLLHSSYGFLEAQHAFDPVLAEKIIRIYEPMWLKIDVSSDAMKKVFMRLHVHSPYK
jgi:hypothetical protein